MTEFGETLLNNSDPKYPITGFVAKTEDDIFEDLIAICQQQFGENIDLTPTSPLAIILHGVAKEQAAMWEALEGLYYSKSITTAEGTDLDNIGIALGLPRYRPTKSTGYMEFTRLRDPVTGVFFRQDPDAGTLLPIPPYAYYFDPVAEGVPCDQFTPEVLAAIAAAKLYADYFKKPLPEISVPEDLIISLTGDETLKYRVDETAIIPGSANSDVPYVVDAPVESIIFGEDGDLNSYYKRSSTFPGAISRILPNSLNGNINMITSVVQETGLYRVSVGMTTTEVTISRKEPLSAEVIICNCWHYYFPLAPNSNGKFTYTPIPDNLYTTSEILAAIEASREIDTSLTVIEIMTSLLTQKLGLTGDGTTPNQNIAIAWKAPDNFNLFNIDFRNIAIDDDETWFIPNPSDESDLLFTYFRPVRDRNRNLLPASLDYLIFRCLTNVIIPANVTSIRIPLMYAGFGGVDDRFYLPDAPSNVKGYIGANHRSVVTGKFFLPPRSDEENTYLFCRPKTTVNNGFKHNIGYALQKYDISGGHDFEADVDYRFRLKSTKYKVTSTGSAIEDYVNSTSGVVSASVYDALMDSDDQTSVGIKIKVRTDDNHAVFTNNSLNTPTGTLINDLVKLIKPAGVAYMFDTGNGYGVTVTVTVVGIDYPNEIIAANIKSALIEYMKSLSSCKPLDYNYVAETISFCKGVKVIKSLSITNGSVLDGGDDPVNPNDGKTYIYQTFSRSSFGDPIYLPDHSYAFLDQDHTNITIVNEKVIHYGGCGRSDNCDQ